MNTDQKEIGRKLSPAEEKRLAHYNELRSVMEADGYTCRELTVGIVKANIFALLLAVPVFAIAFALFILVNRDGNNTGISAGSGIVYLLLLIILVFVHEGLHGITWGIFAPHHMKDIEFGFMKEYLTPYCTCTAPLKKGPYILGAFMPCLVLGIIPCIIAIMTGNISLLILGVIGILTAGGDLMIILMILRYRSKSQDIVWMDHPTQAGCAVFER